MCGIAGFWDPKGNQTESELRAVVGAMSQTLSHRGPDDSGTWVDPSAGIALGHTRLAIIDLSTCGRQPMASACGRYQVVYNGEIYNHEELRREIDHIGKSWRGHSDTEVLLAAYSRWGIHATSRFVGMFAFALWDNHFRRLTLVRDRLGIKPLYYGWIDGVFVFGSELKALRRHPGFRGEIDREALALLLRHNYIPGPWSIYRGIRKLPPGMMLTVSANGRSEPAPYWSLSDVVAAAKDKPFRGNEAEAIAQLDTLLHEAVRLRMIADVPLGAFLSGGIDSSLVVALMQQQSSRPVKTFTIGFEEREYDEAGYARQVAQHLGTEHTELYVSPQETIDVIPRLPEMFDEPFSDSSQIPTFLVSQLARRHVTVSLSGDGGDELFGGYNRYFHIDRLWRAINRIPSGLRVPGVRMAEAFVRRMPDWFARKLAWRLGRFKTASPGEMYASANIHWPDSHALVLGASPVDSVATRPEAWPPGISYLEQWMYADTATYLPDDILVKVDRASMAVGLEARVPLIDHRVVEFSWRLPLAWKIHGQSGKWILRRLLSRYVPESLFERPKMGFGVPIDHWLRGPLRDWAESLLSEKRLRDEGFFDPVPIRRKWLDHLSGRVDWHYHLWDVLMFQAWHEAVSK